MPESAAPDRSTPVRFALDQRSAGQVGPREVAALELGADEVPAGEVDARDERGGVAVVAELVLDPRVDRPARPRA